MVHHGVRVYISERRTLGRMREVVARSYFVLVLKFCNFTLSEHKHLL